MNIKNFLASFLLYSSDSIFNNPYFSDIKIVKLLLISVIILFFVIISLIAVFFLYGKRYKKNKIEKLVLEYTLNSISKGIILLDEKGRVVFINIEALNILKFQEGEVLGKNIDKVYRVYRNNILECLKNPLFRYDKDGENFKYLSLHIKDGSVVKIAETLKFFEVEKVILIIFTDMSKEMNKYNFNYQDVNMSGLGKLASGIAHDFNNLIGGIMGCADLALSPNVSEEIIRECNMDILNITETAKEHISKLLLYSRIELSEKKKINLYKIVKDTVKVVGRTLRDVIDISLESDKDEYFIIADRFQLSSVFFNLIINSRDAINSSEGIIKFTIREEFLDKSFCDNSYFSITEGDYVKIELYDNGCGIEERNISEIFKPYFTTKEAGKGVGLGLPAIYGTVIDHGGAIYVESKLGKYTKFIIYLKKAIKGQDYE